jgi:hypothetical protein
MSMFCFFTSVVGYTSGGVLCDGLRKILQLSVRQSVYPSPDGFQMITLERVEGFSSNFLICFVPYNTDQD